MVWLSFVTDSSSISHAESAASGFCVCTADITFLRLPLSSYACCFTLLTSFFATLIPIAPVIPKATKMQAITINAIRSL